MGLIYLYMNQCTIIYTRLLPISGILHTDVCSKYQRPLQKKVACHQIRKKEKEKSNENKQRTIFS